MSEVPIAEIKSLLPLWKFQWILVKMLAKGKKLKLSKARIRARTRIRAKGKASDTTISQPEQAADPGAPKAQV